MRQTLENYVKDKKVLILGYGREGKSTYHLLMEIGGFSEIAIADKNSCEVSENIKTYFGEDYLSHINDYDIVFKSPGVVVAKSYYKGHADITSMIEQFLKRYGKQTIGVTGTKGKSTVASLINHVLKNEGVDTIFAGNIGVPVFDVIDDIKDDTTIIIELSCHQLEHCRYSPHKAVFLNIFEDHLDHYDDFNAYWNAKKNIYTNQDEEDVVYCLDKVKPDKGTCKSKVVIVGDEKDGFKSFVEGKEKKALPFKSFEEIEAKNFRGMHNVLNCNFVYNVIKEYDITDKSFIEDVKMFETLPHRLEDIGVKDNVRYFDDSIATTAESCISAIESIDDIDTVLIGGMDRGINYDNLIAYLKKGKAKNVILMYESGKRIFKAFNEKNDKINVYYCDNLETAVAKAKEVTTQHKSCVLSPAAASYGDFKNFEERGEKYKEFIFKE